ncbi:MAG: HIRAN domain-containing protein [Elusimicrobiota bacterium]|jgi:hypothetical protein|nr:HIRAN domain-containing protein [Elusimicrobiota bacterium]
MDKTTDEIAVRQPGFVPIDIAHEISLRLKFSPEQFAKIKKGLVSHAMEEKWEIFFENDWLYFHRSWTGHGIYRAKIRKSRDGGYYISEFLAERNVKKYKVTDDKEDIDKFKYLIFWGLLKEDVRSTLFNKVGSDINKISSAWSTFGSMFISKSDTEKYSAKNDDLGKEQEYTRDNIIENQRHWRRELYGSFHLAPESDNVDGLKAGCKLRLAAEPDNRNDSYAVAIYYGERKLGYVPADLSEGISKLLNYGHNDVFEAAIIEIDDKANLDERIYIEITIKDKKGRND